jgi:hypothetical protein
MLILNRIVLILSSIVQRHLRWQEPRVVIGAVSFFLYPVNTR